MEDDDIGLPVGIRRIIKSVKWNKFYTHPYPYNMQMLKNFYSNLVDTSSMRMVVIVRRTNVQFSKATINMMLRLNNVGDTYQHLLEAMDDQDLDVVKDFMCNPRAKWMETNNNFEKMVLRMDLRPEPKI